MGLPAVSFQVHLVCQTCVNCGIMFGVPNDWDYRRREDHKSMYCPNGHSQIYTGKTEAEKLREQLDAEQRRVEMLKRQAEFERSQHVATKGLLTKAKKKLARTENGVCPECNRTFANVARHMISKHGVECNKIPKGRLVRGQK